jgi:hypothetical protein
MIEGLSRGGDPRRTGQTPCGTTGVVVNTLRARRDWKFTLNTTAALSTSYRASDPRSKTQLQCTQAPELVDDSSAT